MNKVGDMLIKKARKEREGLYGKPQEDMMGKDLLSILVAAEMSGDSPMPDQEIRARTFSFVRKP